MDRDTTAKQIIFFLLDMLLIMGAIVGVVSIDGARWLISNPAFYQPPEEALQENAALSVEPQAALPVVIPVTGANAGAETSATASPKTGDGCPAESQLSGPE